MLMGENHNQGWYDYPERKYLCSSPACTQGAAWSYIDMLICPFDTSREYRRRCFSSSNSFMDGENVRRHFDFIQGNIP